MNLKRRNVVKAVGGGGLLLLTAQYGIKQARATDYILDPGEYTRPGQIISLPQPVERRYGFIATEGILLGGVHHIYELRYQVEFEPVITDSSYTLLEPIPVRYTPVIRVNTYSGFIDDFRMGQLSVRARHNESGQEHDVDITPNAITPLFRSEREARATCVHHQFVRDRHGERRAGVSIIVGGSTRR